MRRRGRTYNAGAERTGAARDKGMSRELNKSKQDAIIKNQKIRAASRRRTATTVIIIFLLCALLLTGAAWGTIAFIDANSMRIVVDKNNVGDISISKTADFDSPATVLKMDGPEELSNITYDWIHKDEVFGKEGDHHGDNYIAYSFFLKNVSDSNILFKNSIVLNYVSKDIERAVRIIVIEDEEKATCYAVSRSDGTPEYIAYDTDDKATQQPLPLGDSKLDALLATNVTTVFASDEPKDDNVEVFESADTFLAVGEVKKYTVLIWLEGSDSDCMDAIIGAKVNFEFSFRVTQADAIQP